MSSTTPGWKNRKQAAQVLQSLKTLCLLGARRPADQCHRHAGRCSGSCGRSGRRRLRRVAGARAHRVGVFGRPSAATPRATTLRVEEALPKRSAVAKVEHHAALESCAREGVQALAFTPFF
jgi:hypothetical protein